MVINLPAFQATCGAVLGGLNTLALIPWASVLEIPAAAGHIIATPITLEAGAVYSFIQFPEGTGEFTEKPAANDNGDYFKQGLTVFVPKDCPEIAALAARATSIKYFLAIYTDNNGYIKLVGSKEYPLKFTCETETGSNARDKNGTEIKLTSESPEKAYFYLDNPEPPQQGGGGSGEPVKIMKGNGEVVALVQPGQSFVISSGFSWGFNII